MSAQVDLAVVGGGPAGISAALAAASTGAEVVLIDEAPRPGGQYYKQLPQDFDCQDNTHHATESRALLDELYTSAAQILTGTVVWGVYPEQSGDTYPERSGDTCPEQSGDTYPERSGDTRPKRSGDTYPEQSGETFTTSDGEGWLLTLKGERSPRKLNARTIVLATGAYDRPIAFPGWTLPGVLTAGAVQILVKHQRILPGRRFLLSGTGPLQLALADNLVRAGAEVVAVLEAKRVREIGSGWLRHAPALWGQWKRLREGWIYGHTLLRARVPFRTGWSVTAVQGDGQVEEALIARVDSEGYPIPNTEKRLEIDTLVVGFGLLPNTMMSRLMGCEHILTPGKDLIPIRDATLQTTLPGVYAAGDCAGIGGAELARLEGKLAGLSAARQLGYLDDTGFEAARASLRQPLARQRHFAQMLEALFTPRAGLYNLATDDTLICRCEEVTLGDIRSAIGKGSASLGEIKRLTRAGMGNCQGRMCSALLARALVENVPQLTLESVGSLSVRPPLHPLRLSELAQHVNEMDSVVSFWQ